MIQDMEPTIIGPKLGGLLHDRWVIGWKFVTHGRSYGEMIFINGTELTPEIFEQARTDALDHASKWYRRYSGRLWRLWHLYAWLRMKVMP